MSAVAWKSDGVETLFPESWRLWQLGGGPPPPTAPGDGPETRRDESAGPPPSAGGAPRPDGTPEPGGGPVLWHQVQPSEDWAGLVARYNIAEPQALLAANGLTEPRDLLPGDWVCVPCRLARPVWELPLPEEGEAPHD
ncbi:MAG: LysM peptidoglycan-binding domain-containing protein [Firmicutes bacterium]|nr:LysM peptidoglycan-binding domain-containing protein [Bacillota bacterium]